MFPKLMTVGGGEGLLSALNTVVYTMINTEEKKKVAAAAWGLEFIQFLAALCSYFPPGRFEEKEE